MSTEEQLQEVIDSVQESTPAIERIWSEVWDLSELSLAEVQSAAVHLRELKAAGFSITSLGTSGIPTAFIAEWKQGEGGAKVGFLPEFDALPGLSNETVPYRKPRNNGNSSGHGCGHNMLGASLTGAAIALKSVMEANGTPGTLRVYGAAAEEQEGSKVYMAREGLFNDLDACLHWHPMDVATVINMRFAAANMMKIHFYGTTAHAGAEPWKGRSALHALELCQHGINLMREHILPTARIHYIVEQGGVAPNIVADYARLYLFVRDENRDHVVEMTEWIRQVAEGAALATQTRADVNVYFGLHDLIPNAPLAERMQRHMERVGVPQWTEEEQAFAKACQREMRVPEKGMATFVVPLQPEVTLGGSSDVSDVSWLTPTIGLAMPTLPLGVSLHTWPVTACGGMSIGWKATVAATEVLALTAMDILTDADLRTAARADFEKRMEGKVYESPLPETQESPLGLPDWVKGKAEEILSNVP